MRPSHLVGLVLVPLLLAPLVPAESCATREPLATLGDHYVDTEPGNGFVTVEAAGARVRVENAYWPLGVHSRVWEETNGIPGLQRPGQTCSPDTLVAYVFVGAGRPTIFQ